MQKLVFESAWDKTIAPADRSAIAELFHQTKEPRNDQVKLLPIRQAYNHKNDLLAIVLLHNFSDEVFSLENIKVAYFENDRMLAEEHFSFPSLTLQPKTSMPWTFIFPESSRVEEPTLIDGFLVLLKD